MTKRKMTNTHTMVQKTLQRELNIKQHEPQINLSFAIMSFDFKSNNYLSLRVY